MFYHTPFFLEVPMRRSPAYCSGMDKDRSRTDIYAVNSNEKAQGMDLAYILQ
jgi:hypothetical protein